jgi:hypothetical protein
MKKKLHLLLHKLSLFRTDFQEIRPLRQSGDIQPLSRFARQHYYHAKA